MANMASPNRTDSSPLRDATDSVRDSAQQLKSNLNPKIDQASQMASEFYSNAQTWLQGNYGKALGGFALIAAVGMIGYFVGRNSQHDDFSV